MGTLNTALLSVSLHQSTAASCVVLITDGVEGMADTDWFETTVMAYAKQVGCGLIINGEGGGMLNNFFSSLFFCVVYGYMGCGAAEATCLGFVLLF